MNEPDDLPEIRALFQTVTPPPDLDRWRRDAQTPRPVPRRRRFVVVAACAAAVVALAGGIPAIVRLSGTPQPMPSPSASSDAPIPSPSTVPSSSGIPSLSAIPGLSAAPSSSPTLSRYDGDLVVTEAGAVIDGMQVNGSVIVQAADVHIRRVKIMATAGSYWVIRQAPGATGLVVEDSELDGRGSHDGIKQEASGLTVRRTQIRRVDTGISVGDGGDIEGCTITDVATGVGTSTGGSHITIRDNTITTAKSSVEAAIGLYTTTGDLHDVTVEGNRLAGGNYTFHVGEGPGAQEIVARHNQFGRSVHPKGGFYGPVAGWNAQAKGNMWTDNAWADTGAQISP
ncbi:right-handed parallel beta-helix repeat-containing protein [Dactylosporangium matsuzakiense]|uniref:Right handed beta helix domain-containing protein n=1 Tax=Dactylosporangium matsuzakiense TaxID=53360 RepID=A0A9W6NJ65_9ACTN|nr:right-handed parallel beta-helix repeat-containing protein [Dactylosporangium matsuzakiense]UWZ45303.1 right-handed parallel beta-helix repeat-containing protein [Dactylosporangium matsuzakiense]GLK98722.1 hypothetical protein GCM10017581_004630 [Dactylosporangium matsuzakiense]